MILNYLNAKGLFFFLLTVYNEYSANTMHKQNSRTLK